MHPHATSGKRTSDESSPVHVEQKRVWMKPAETCSPIHALRCIVNAPRNCPSSHRMEHGTRLSTRCTPSSYHTTAHAHSNKRRSTPRCISFRQTTVGSVEFHVGKEETRTSKDASTPTSSAIRQLQRTSRPATMNGTAKEDGRASDGTLAGYDRIEDILEEFVPEPQLEHVKRVLYGHNQGRIVSKIALPSHVSTLSEAQDFDLQGYRFEASKEQLREPRVVKIGLVQHGIRKETTAPYAEQRDAIHVRVAELVNAAGEAQVNVLCLQETWHIPFAFCTREKQWCEFAETLDGPSVGMCRKLAEKWSMVMICPILERDETHGNTIWNTAVVISHTGKIIGKHRKNHIPRVGDFNESTYYMEGNSGHPVYETYYGKIGVNICYGRHHPLNWMAFGLNGAEIVFNPSATVGDLSEPMWAIEARNAAIANSYYVAAINRVGTEHFPNAFTSGDGKPSHHDFGHFYGSSYLQDKWGFRMTARYELYHSLLARYICEDFQPQVVRDPSLGL